MQKGNMVSLITQGHQYIRNGDGEEELYDLKLDPRQQRNLIHHGAENLRGTMRHAWRSCSMNPPRDADHAAFAAGIHFAIQSTAA